MLKLTVGDLGVSLPRGPLRTQPRTVLVANDPPFSLFLFLVAVIIEAHRYR